MARQIQKHYPKACGLSLSSAIPDESTILKFRYLLEDHDLGSKLFKTINKVLDHEGLMLREGTIVVRA